MIFFYLINIIGTNEEAICEDIFSKLRDVFSGLLSMFKQVIPTLGEFGGWARPFL